MSKDFLTDYLYYNSGHEAPQEFCLWSGLTLLSTIVGNRVKFNFATGDGFSQLCVRPNLLVALVAPMGKRKSFAKDIVQDLITDHFPDIAMGANSDTREAITKWWASDDAIRSYLKPNGDLITYRPLFLPVNELENFISVNPRNMIAFLTDAADRYELFRVRTKGQGEDIIKKGYITMLACATTEYITEMLKAKVLSGGIARRIVWVCKDSYVRNGNPGIKAGGMEAFARCVDHLKNVQRICHGDFQWSIEDDAQRFYVRWYETLKFPTDPLMVGFYESKHMIMLRVTMLLAMCNYDLTELAKLVIKKEHIVEATALVTSVEPGMEKLFMRSGRNELIGPQADLLNILLLAGGGMSKKNLHRKLDPSMDPIEQGRVLQHLCITTGILKYPVFMEREQEDGTVLPAKEEVWIIEEYEKKVIDRKIIAGKGTSMRLLK